VKILFPSKKVSGQVLLVCLGIATVLGISLAGIFAYTSNQYAAVARSQAWNESLVLAEAGIEDGLQLINKNSNTGVAGTAWTATAAADNWTVLAGNVYHVRRYINSNYYDVYITNSNPNQPIIRSTGVKSWLTTFNGGKGNISRTVVIETASGSLFQAGLLAKGGITLNGNVVIDSFNSQNPTNSTNGKYDPTKRKDAGNVATVDSNIVATITVGGSVDVYGKIYTGTGDSISVLGGGSVGSLTWVNSGSSGIQSGWSQTDLNIAIPDAETPGFTTGLGFPSKTTYSLNGTNYSNSYLLTAGNYKQSSAVSLSSSEKILVQGNVKLHMNAMLKLSGNSQILIGTNSSLTIYASSTLDFSGGGVANGTGYATNLTVYGQPSWAAAAP
jgi:hypothetical protein